MLNPKAGRLATFVRKECANYDGHYNLCCDPAKNDQDEPPCEVLRGNPCRYFERAVLGPPDYPYKTVGYDWGKLFAAYGEINAAFSARGVTVRRCECGTPLGHRERVCAKCRVRRRKQTYRQYRKGNKKPDAHRARSIVRNAITNGSLKKQPCVRCGNPETQGHHPDYSRPLDVIWLCRKHHREEHRGGLSATVNGETTPANTDE